MRVISDLFLDKKVACDTLNEAIQACKDECGVCGDSIRQDEDGLAVRIQNGHIGERFVAYVSSKKKAGL